MNNRIKPPKFNDVPFLKLKLPQNVYTKIKEEYLNAKFLNKINDVEYSKEYKVINVGAISVKNSSKPHYFKEDITDELTDLCYREITPIAEDWCGKKLEKSWAYGMRSYIKNSILHLHRDRTDTHVISCIIYIDQKSYKNWPLDFYDHDNNHHQVFFEDGDMLLYESLCVHGRETPFNGEYYRNMYFHWRPQDWDPKPYQNMKCSFINGNHLKNFYPRDSS